MISRIFMTRIHEPVPEDNFLTCDKDSDTEEIGTHSRKLELFLFQSLVQRVSDNFDFHERSPE